MHSAAGAACALTQYCVREKAAWQTAAETHVQHVRQEVKHDLRRFVGGRQQHVRLPLLQVTRPRFLEEALDTATGAPVRSLSRNGSKGASGLFALMRRQRHIQHLVKVRRELVLPLLRQQLRVIGRYPGLAPLPGVLDGLNRHDTRFACVRLDLSTCTTCRCRAPDHDHSRIPPAQLAWLVLCTNERGKPECLLSGRTLKNTAACTLGSCLGGGSRPALMAFSTSLAACSRRFRFSFCARATCAAAQAAQQITVGFRGLKRMRMHHGQACEG